MILPKWKETKEGIIVLIEEDLITEMKIIITITIIEILIRIGELEVIALILIEIDVPALGMEEVELPEEWMEWIYKEEGDDLTVIMYIYIDIFILKMLIGKKKQYV